MRKFMIITCLLLLLVGNVHSDTNNVTSKLVPLKERSVIIEFHNMGVDAYWGRDVLNEAATALPILEDFIGVPLPEEVEKVIIIGERKWKEEWAFFVGINENGERIRLEKDHPNPMTIYHEITHFWTISGNFPYPLSEGFAEYYAYLTARELGYSEVSKLSLDANLQNALVEEPEKGQTTLALNSFDYFESTDKQKINDFYAISFTMYYNLANQENLGLETLKKINERVMNSEIDASVGGIGVIQYLEIVRELTGISYSHLLMPCFFTRWDEKTAKEFDEALAHRRETIKVIGQDERENQNLKSATELLLSGNTQASILAYQNAIKIYFEELEKEQETSIELPPPERSLFERYGKYMLGFGIFLIVVALIGILIRALSKRGEEEEFEVMLGEPYSPSTPPSKEEISFEEIVGKREE
ncbi:MAG: hypothetical protein ACE5K0_04095 [Candidatus Methanofastidiosia archaeon]